jgi:hypothetical protein
MQMLHSETDKAGKVPKDTKYHLLLHICYISSPVNYSSQENIWLYCKILKA